MTNTLFKNEAEEIAFLKTALKNLYNSFLYSQEYTRYCLNYYSEEEFDEIAEKFAISHQQFDDDKIFLMAEYLQENLDKYIDLVNISDIADIDFMKLIRLHNDKKQIMFFREEDLDEI